MAKVITPNGKKLEVNDYVVELIKRGEKSLDGFALPKPKAKKKKAE